MAFLSVPTMSHSRSNRALAMPARRAGRAPAARLTRFAAHPATAAPARHQVSMLQNRIREAGGPEDHALYTCGCGYAFEADVSSSVSCPHCGADQTW